MSWAVGVDIGGTKIEAGLVDAQGNLLKTVRRLTEAHRGPDFVLHRLVEAIEAAMAGEAVKAVGIGFAGQVDPQEGVVYYAPNLPGWHDVPLRADLEHRLRRPVFIINDVQAATWAEWRLGAGRGVANLVCVFLGTGVGGGVVIGGRLRSGASGSLGEIGHVPIVVDGRRCRCGGRGCLEAYVGGWAIAEQVAEDMQARPEAWGETAELADGLTAETVARLAREGHPRARAWVQRIGVYLGYGLRGLVNVLNPQRLILGGGLLQGFPTWPQQVAAYLQSQALPPAQTVEVRTAVLGVHAAVVGSALQALEYYG